MPFNWSPVSDEDRGRGVWDRDDPRVITPKNYGWGFSINFAALFGRRRPPSDQDQER